MGTMLQLKKILEENVSKIFRILKETTICSLTQPQDQSGACRLFWNWADIANQYLSGTTTWPITILEYVYEFKLWGQTSLK
jgi:hypothetical protein